MGLLRDNCKKLGNVLKTAISNRFIEKTRGLKGELILKGYEKGELVYEYKHSNVIVNTASILIARLLKDNKEPVAGISYLAVGSGNSGWDLFDPPAPTTSATRLENEYYRKAIEISTFVNPETGEPTTSYTNIIDFSVTLGEAEGVGPIVELGMFGGDATDQLGTGTLLNNRTFPVINKTSTMTLTVIFRITA